MVLFRFQISLDQIKNLATPILNISHIRQKYFGFVLFFNLVL